MQRIKEWKNKIQHQKPTLKDIILCYSVIGAILIGNLHHLNSLGYAPSTLLLEQVMPRHSQRDLYKKLLYKWGYTLTQIDWEEPSKIIMSLSPYMKKCYLEHMAEGEIKGYFEQDENTYLEDTLGESYEPAKPHYNISLDERFKDAAYVYKNYMSAPASMEFDLDMLQKWDFYELVNKPIRLSSLYEGPKVLVFHTHVREEYIGGLTVADIGEALKKQLEEQYGIKVLHVMDSFYDLGNTGNRPKGGEYERMEPVIEKVLAENPSISVVIDLHRDGVNENVHLVTDIEGKSTAKIMFVNGLCLNRSISGEVEDKVDLPNPYIGDNLAFSLQALIQMNVSYPGLSRKIYLNEWRYSTHMRPNSLLMEWGAQTNTSEEALNAVAPVAEILAKVLQKD